MNNSYSQTQFRMLLADHTPSSDRNEIEQQMNLYIQEYITNRLSRDERLDTGYVGLLMLSVAASMNRSLSSAQRQGTKLNPTEINALKTASSMLCKQQPIIDMHKQCSICHETIKRRTMLKCNHAFHWNCIIAWLNTGARSCPTCRAVIVCS
jgi:hypothetical protein